MRINIPLLSLALAALLAACDRQPPAPAIDPRLGTDCFESLRASLPPGTQYEGIEQVSGDRLTIRIMDGVNVVTKECRLNPDGTLENTQEQMH